MSKFISQSTFDEAVKDMVDSFGMELSEAIEDAKKQFEMQGVNLCSVSPMNLLHGKDNAVELSGKLGEMSGRRVDFDNETLKITLESLKDICAADKGSCFRAMQSNACDFIFDILSRVEAKEKDLKKLLIGTLIEINKEYFLDLKENSAEILIKALTDEKDVDVSILYLQYYTQCSKFQEKNRRLLTMKGLIPVLAELLSSNDGHKERLMRLLNLLQALLVDDDRSEETSDVHRRAVEICKTALLDLVGALKMAYDEEIITDVLKTLSLCIVRNEFCQDFADAHGLEKISHLLTYKPDSEKICSNCMCLLKAVSGNDQVKAKMFEVVPARDIVSSIEKFLKKPSSCLRGLSLVAALALRNANNGKVLCENGASNVIVQAAKIHGGNPKVQKQVSWCIRNIVTRNKETGSLFLSCGIEDILLETSQKYEACRFEANAALNALGCDAKHNELWKGVKEPMKNDPNF